MILNLRRNRPLLVLSSVLLALCTVVTFSEGKIGDRAKRFRERLPSEHNEEIGVHGNEDLAATDTTTASSVSTQPDGRAAPIEVVYVEESFHQDATGTERGDPKEVLYTSPEGTVVTQGDMDAFKADWDVKASSELPLQTMMGIPVESQTITITGTVFSLAGLEPVEAFGGGVTTHWVDGVEVPNGPPLMFIKNTGTGTHLMVKMTKSDYSSAKDIASIVVTLPSGSAEIVPIKDNVFVTVMSGDIDYDAINTKYSYGDSLP